jgi:hypothetical protein
MYMFTRIPAVCRDSHNSCKATGQREASERDHNNNIDSMCHDTLSPCQRATAAHTWPLHCYSNSFDPLILTGTLARKQYRYIQSRARRCCKNRLQARNQDITHAPTACRVLHHRVRINRTCSANASATTVTTTGPKTPLSLTLAAQLYAAAE